MLDGIVDFCTLHIHCTVVKANGNSRIDSALESAQTLVTLGDIGINGPTVTEDLNFFCFISRVSPTL